MQKRGEEETKRMQKKDEEETKRALARETEDTKRWGIVKDGRTEVVRWLSVPISLSSVSHKSCQVFRSD